ncbi:MAG: type II toxin-antitoxin system PemK/MazF family toxin [Candidatus Gracilibacteria bacterium]|nr:type II toxin-antitoxin system PemK/MazF family toxin [Candidatus Gracilibacteria bacterium]
MEKIIRRGDIFLIDFSPSRGSQQSGLRPGVVVQCDAMNATSTKTVLVCPFTSNLRRKDFYYNTSVRNTKGNGLKKECVILGDQLTVINTTQFKHRIGNLSESDMRFLNRALMTILELF